MTSEVRVGPNGAVVVGVYNHAEFMEARVSVIGNVVPWGTPKIQEAMR